MRAVSFHLMGCSSSGPVVGIQASPIQSFRPASRLPRFGDAGTLEIRKLLLGSPRKGKDKVRRQAINTVRLLAVRRKKCRDAVKANLVFRVGWSTLDDEQPKQVYRHIALGKDFDPAIFPSRW